MITNKESLESFINFCNDMEIAEEGKIIDNIKRVINNTNADSKKWRKNHSTPINRDTTYKKELLERKNKAEKRTKEINKIIKDIGVKETPLPNNFDINNENIVRKYCELARKDTINYIKKYISHPSFKSKYSQYLSLINVTPVDYADEFDIEFTEYQSVYDYDRNDWYYELLEAGKMIADEVFNDKIVRAVTTGDGDEGCIYICTILN